jgi:NAD(P)-dependent dehydrogenase (short-subunit alcohol dehydrogenase family)
MRLQGKVAIITGATGGIGEATARRFLEEGARVMLVGRSAQKLRESRERLGPQTSLAHHVAEASDEAANAAAVAATRAAFGGLDIMVANAGAEGTVRPLEAQTMEDFDAVLRTNVLGVWISMKTSIDAMRARGAGSIIALSSIAGLVGFPNLMPYIASKHAVYGMVKTAALELAASNIRVNAIGPGPIANRMIRSLETQLSPGDPKAVEEMMRSLVPLKRYGTNEEVANLALFLASDEASYCTGGMYTIDGGFTAA